MADFDRVRDGVQLMIDKGAPLEHINGYLKREGYDSPSAWMAALQAAQTPAAAEATQGPQLEFPDAPTTAKMPLPGLFDKSSFGGVGKYLGFGDESMNVGSKAAALFGPTITDNPKARQEIYTKNVPGAEAVSDKFGNPMIKYKGKQYYTARPGEFDAMDAGRIATGVSASLPLMAFTPATAIGTAVAGGLTSGGMSLAEDSLTSMAGGTSQELDLGKAGLATLFGATIPVVGNKLASSAAPLARNVSARLTGGIPARAQRALAEMGVDAADLTARQLASVTKHGLQRGWNNQEMNAALMKSLGEEFKTGLRTGQMTNNYATKQAEDRLLHGAGGDTAGHKMSVFADKQVQQLNEAGKGVRARATGSGHALTPEEIGATLSSEYRAADKAAKKAVTQSYDDAFDQQKLAAAGVPLIVPRADVRQLQPNLYNAFTDPKTGVIEQVTQEAHPKTMAAIKFLTEFSENGKIPGAFPGRAPPAGQAVGDMDWQTVESARKYINTLRTGAKRDPVEGRTLGMVLDAFDDTFGKNNPLLNAARQGHSERVQLFRPQRNNATGVNAPLETMANPKESGMSTFRSVVGSALKSGEGAPLVQHLKKVFANSPEAMTALKEAFLSRVLVNPATNELLTPLAARTALKKALGGAEGPAYRELFADASLKEMGRFQTLLDRVGSTNARVNAPGSGYQPTLAVDKARAAITGGGIGGALGAAAGSLTGLPFGIPLGIAGGAWAGNKVGQGVARVGANRAADRSIQGVLPSVGSTRAYPLPSGYLANEYRDEQRARGGYLRMRGR